VRVTGLPVSSGMIGCSSRPRRIDIPIVMLKNRSSPGAPEPAGVERHGRPARPAARQLEHEPPAQRAADEVDPGAAVVGDEAGDGVGERHHGLLAGQQRGLAEAGHSTATTFRSAANPSKDGVPRLPPRPEAVHEQQRLPAAEVDVAHLHGAALW